MLLTRTVDEPELLSTSQRRHNSPSSQRRRQSCGSNAISARHCMLINSVTRNIGPDYTGPITAVLVTYGLHHNDTASGKHNMGRLFWYFVCKTWSTKSRQLGSQLRYHPRFQLTTYRNYCHDIPANHISTVVLSLGIFDQVVCRPSNITLLCEPRAWRCQAVSGGPKRTNNTILKHKYGRLHHDRSKIKFYKKWV